MSQSVISYCHFIGNLLVWIYSSVTLSWCWSRFDASKLSVGGLDFIVEMVSASLTSEARFVLEHSSRGTLPSAPQSLMLDRTRSHGDSAFTIYKRVDN